MNFLLSADMYVHEHKDEYTFVTLHINWQVISLTKFKSSTCILVNNNNKKKKNTIRLSKKVGEKWQIFWNGWSTGWEKKYTKNKNI